jgi:spore maturation protein CgeB
MVGDVHCHDIEGECHELWTSLYVNNIRQLRIHIALPSNNPMIVGRPFETLACGTFLLSCDKLPEPLVEGQHYRQYDPGGLKHTARIIEYYLAHEDEREKIAADGCKVVHEEYSARKFWADALDPSERL